MPVHTVDEAVALLEPGFKGGPVGIGRRSAIRREGAFDHAIEVGLKLAREQNRTHVRWQSRGSNSNSNPRPRVVCTG